MSAKFHDLVELMARLRSPEGCPWDREQTYATLAPMLLDEAYEVFEAAGEASGGRPANLLEELGDLLFLVVFYAQVARERGEFTIDEVAAAVHTKMVRRHPHVFADVTVRDNEELLRNWDAIKAEEKRAAGKGEAAEDASLLDDVPPEAPALREAHRLGAKAARVGFDWRHVEEIFDKLHEEIDELRAAIGERRDAGPDADAAQERVREELGDLLFAVTNIARHTHVEPESALKLTNRKFRRRFRHIERGLKEGGRRLGEATLDEMEALWQEAKRHEGADE